jgi:hypothetical protein
MFGPRGARTARPSVGGVTGADFGITQKVSTRSRHECALPGRRWSVIGLSPTPPLSLDHNSKSSCPAVFLRRAPSSSRDRRAPAEVFPASLWRPFWRSHSPVRGVPTALAGHHAAIVSRCVRQLLVQGESRADAGGMVSGATEMKGPQTRCKTAGILPGPPCQGLRTVYSEYCDIVDTCSDCSRSRRGQSIVCCPTSYLTFRPAA